MNDSVEPDRTQPGSAIWLTICGTVGAVIGGPGAVFLGMLLANLYVVIWDPKPSSSFGYQDPFSGLETALLVGCVVFIVGAAVGAFVAVVAGRRWSRRRPSEPSPAGGWRQP